MPHPIWGRPQHQLEAVYFQIYLPSVENSRTTTMIATGTSRTSRPSMWSIREQWVGGEQERGYQPGDALHHVCMTAMQDRPTSQAQMEACMIGEGWKQDSMF